MRRWTGIVGVGACLTGAVALSLLLAQSYRRSVSVRFIYHEAQWQVAAERGRVRVDNWPEVDFEQRDIRRLQFVVAGWQRVYLGTMLDAPNLESRSPVELAKAVTGVEASRKFAQARAELAWWQAAYRAQPVSRSLHLMIPIALLMVLPFVRVAYWWRGRRRARRGLCTGCGYDLRATGDRCPECGREVRGRMEGTSKSRPSATADFVRPTSLG